MRPIIRVVHTGHWRLIPAWSIDHVQIAALTKALKLNIQVAYLDGHSEEVNFVDFKSVPPEPNENVPVLLYRYV